MLWRGGTRSKSRIAPAHSTPQSTPSSRPEQWHRVYAFTLERRVDDRGLGKDQRRSRTVAEIALVRVRHEAVRKAGGDGSDPAHPPAAERPHARSGRRAGGAAR